MPSFSWRVPEDLAALGLNSCAAPCPALGGAEQWLSPLNRAATVSTTPFCLPGTEAVGQDPLCFFALSS